MDSACQTDALAHLSQSTTSTIQFDTIIVFGQGPVKPVLIRNELSFEQKKHWEEFQKDPIHVKEPNFWLLNEPSYLEKLEQIWVDKTLSDDEKELQVEQKRIDWQNTGHFALKRWGRQNALAAGLALYSGFTTRLIVSGGKTKPAFVKELLPNRRLDDWPSEAALMKDIITQNYGKLYFEKYKRHIAEAIVVEDAATNTLENFAFTLQQNQDLLLEGVRVGLLSAKHHLKRISILAKIFALQGASEFLLSAEDLMEKVKLEANKKYFEDVMQSLQNSEECFDLCVLRKEELRWIKALEDPTYISYWCGFLGDLQNPILIQKAILKLFQPVWIEKTKEVFEVVGLSVEEYKEQNLVELAKNNHVKYLTLVEGLKKLKAPQYRKMPPAML